jgi:hypothetical protein
VSEVQALTARRLGPPGFACASVFAQCEAVPEGLEPVAVRAVTLMAEQIAVTSEKKLARQRASRLRLRGFSAGPYSEQYWDPGMVRGGSSGQGRRPTLIDDPDLDDLLWMRATDDARDEIVARATGMMPPAGVASQIDYRRQGLAGLVQGPFGPGGGLGPDGF